MIKEISSKYYGVKTISKAIKDVDTSKRVVTGIFNSYYYIDSDNDMLVDGCAKKSISDRGANSNAVAKIKHLKDHDFSLNVARLNVIDEREVDFGNKKIKGIYHESYFPNTTLGNDMLINIQEEVYDNRSIGFRYKDIQIAVRDPEEYFSNDTPAYIKKAARKNWIKYYPLALNPEIADQNGFFNIVKEIELFEGSDVSFGANSLTPMLGVKSTDKETLLRTLNEKQDNLIHQVKTGYQSDLCLRELEIQMLQIKQMQKELSEYQPLIKGTPKVEPLKADTVEQIVDYKSIFNNLKF